MGERDLFMRQQNTGHKHKEKHRKFHKESTKKKGTSSIIYKNYLNKICWRWRLGLQELWVKRQANVRGSGGLMNSTSVASINLNWIFIMERKTEGDPVDAQTRRFGPSVGLSASSGATIWLMGKQKQ